MDPMLALAGAMTGMLVGLTGVGGGALMTPILLLLFGIAPQTAVGTDLWFASLTKLAATRVHHTHGLIDRQVLFRLWRGSLPAAAATLLAMKFLPGSAASLNGLKAAIAIAVLLTGVGIVFQRRLNEMGRQWRLRHATRFRAAQG
ncbi:MAG: sulfite exporter TauE/SafE family protein, partial [Rhodocyclaceae bacterium]|nr:sulfite exporter TauE/SafE family protein [Rhodocyclaceae bacterium]